MNVFRWIVGGMALLLGSGALLSFVVFMITGIDLWIERARKLRRIAWAAFLFWINIEIWGRVAYTLYHWNG